MARLRLFCFPYAGGGASIFRAWSNELPQEIETCAVQLPGREGRLKEPPFTHFDPLVQALAQALRSRLGAGAPFAFFGHSLGALISFELTRLLSSLRDPLPIHLFVSGHRAPQLPSSHDPVHHLPEAEFIEELRKLNGTPETILRDPSLLELFLPTLRVDFAISETYTYTTQAPLECPISAFGGLQDEHVSRDELEAWRAQTRSTFTLRMFPGDHFYLHSAQTRLLRAIAHDLARPLISLTKGRRV